jgi:hypothetical protein
MSLRALLIAFHVISTASVLFGNIILIPKQERPALTFNYEGKFKIVNFADL